MRSIRKTLGYTAALAVALAATPALASPGHDHGYDRGGYEPARGASFRVDPAAAARCGLGAGSMRPAAYYSDYDRRHSDNGLGGALIGGAVGGLLGNRIAGRGDRTIGTIAGAAVGAIAGAAIDRSENRAEDRYGDRDGAWRGDGPGYDRGGYDGGGYDGECDSLLPPGYRLVSVPGEQECRDEVTTTEEWVPEYVTVPGRPTWRAPPRDKRTKLRRVK